MFTLIAVLFLCITILDVLLIYTFFAIKGVNLVLELKRLFIQQNGIIFIVLNLLHSILFAYTILNLNPVLIACSVLFSCVYLFPNILHKLLNLRFRKKRTGSKYNLSAKEEKVLLEKLERGGASQEFIQSVKNELKEKK